MRGIRHIALPFILFFAVAGCNLGDGIAAGEPDPPGGSSPCPFETRAPNATGQTPAFDGQTRACGVTSDEEYVVTVVASGLDHPWAVEPLPNGDLLVTERPGRLRVITAAGQVGEPVTGLPAVEARGQGGLLDVALSPTFETDRTIFWSYAERRQGGNGTAVARGVLSADGRSVSDVGVIFRAMPTYNGELHYGSRLAFGPEGSLFISIGERSDTPMRMRAQELGSTLGKIVRVLPDGSIPPDNPFIGQTGAQTAIWSYGHRNPQAMGFDGEGRLWEVEHGTRGGDEVNLIQPGRNYGWPLQAYGIEYGGGSIGSAETARPGMEQPVYYWDPVIAPSGMAYYDADLFPEWQGSMLIGGLATEGLVRLTLDGDRVASEERIDLGHRIRDVKVGPDGAVYAVTDRDGGQILRVAPGGES